MQNEGAQDVYTCALLAKNVRISVINVYTSLLLLAYLCVFSVLIFIFVKEKNIYRQRYILTFTEHMFKTGRNPCKIKGLRPVRKNK